ncbi:hypothetical protein [Legionella sp. 16cNR16C]|uniref:Uncharacterized protein n=2 Tax=Legionella quinlivanii TaxID=45073 RepID=A0A364LFV2_9GAMM|nr:hypothetical protein [Legionella sp. 16cNR16C]MCE3045466.1 hypothetical protein [Legionella sp. 16cNR16C]RAP34930.1 hypothetical protein B1207_14670 [Legionella quinlivanii]
MFGSIKVFLRNKIIKSQEQALKQYIQSLQGLDEAELAHLVVMATIIRNVSFQNTGIDYLDPINELEKNPYVVLEIGNQIKEFQRGNKYDRAGYLTVWLYTFRSISEPELRIYGKQLWKELSRGIMFIMGNLGMLVAYSQGSDTTGYDQIPLGLQSNQ